MKILKENLLPILVITLLATIVGYLLICSYFSKKTSFRAFEECLTTITNEGNWNTRKETVQYCIDETR